MYHINVGFTIAFNLQFSLGICEKNNGLSFLMSSKKSVTPLTANIPVTLHHQDRLSITQNALLYYTRRVLYSLFMYVYQS